MTSTEGIIIMLLKHGVFGYQPAFKCMISLCVHKNTLNSSLQLVKGLKA